ncbi:extracellular solute-binding protein [Candidatus Poribacteria bacterium]
MRNRLPIRGPYIVLAGIIAIVVVVGILERRPTIKEDFDSARDTAFADTWDQRVHISYWEKWGSFEREACQTMVDAFNKSQDEIFVHFINTSEVDRKAMLAIMGHDPPDVVGLWATNVPSFSAAGALLDLEGLMASTKLDKERYIPNYLKLGMYNERLYALPTTPSSVGLYYNKEHFREAAEELRAAGLDPERAPRDTEELDRYAEVLNIFDEDGRPLRMGFLPSEPGWFNWTWGFYFGGKLFDEESGTITTDDPKNVEAFLWTKRYAERYGREKLLQFRSGFGNFDSPQNAFIDGRVSMEIQGVWFSNFIRRHRPHTEFGVAPAPAAPGIPGPVSVVDCDVIAIPRGCRNVEAAWRFIDFSQREGLAILCRLQGKHMPIKEPPPNFRDGHPNLEVGIFEEHAASPYTFIQPRLRVWNEYSHEMDKTFEHVWNWPVPEEELTGLTGDARQQKVDDLCRAEIKRTLQVVRERMQRQYDNMRERDKLRLGTMAVMED